MKKILSLVLALLMIVSCISMVAAEDTAITDEVVETEDAGSYAFAIEFLTKYGIYKGGEPASADIQRYQMALFVARIATGWTDDATWEDGTLNSSEFVDIDTAPANNYYGAISYVNQKGIIEGYGDGNFGPYDGITYQDALAMLVRTLGWNNLKYPWGVIEQAVEIGLTEGIEGVAYTDVLTRAEVAQLVYNALFINGKDGLTLASTSFDMEDGWQTIIITSTPYGTYSANDGKVGGGKVGFRVLNADGSMGNTLYTANASEMGLNGTQTAEKLGYVYKVIFEANNRNLAKVLAYKSLYLETIWNNGSTDDNGKKQLNAIEAWLATQKVVTKYSDDEYYYGTGFATDEFILISAEEQFGTKTVVTDKAKYGINWATGDIVELNWDGNTASIAKTIWYYQADLDTYFQYKFDATGTTVVTHYMTEADFAELPELLQERLTAEVSTSGRYLGFSLGAMTYRSAYASLELFDTNEDGVADRGYYERYQFGRITLGSRTCGSCGTVIPTVTFSNVGNEPANRTSDNDAWKFNPDPGNGYFNNGYLAGAYSYTFDREGGCGHASSSYWFNSDFSVSESCVGIFKYDTSTQEIKVIKTVEDKSATTDADTYSSKGMVKAWSVTKRTVTIVDADGTINEFTLDYFELFRYEHRWSDYWGIYSKIFAERMEKMFMNYVNYMVVDGVLVSITLDGVDTENVIVVDEYLGLDSETGLITVAGYSTETLKRREYKLLTVDGWISGDWFNTSNKYVLETMAKTFSMGAVLNITSYDKDLKAYNVDIAGEYDANGKFVVNTANGLNSSTITLDFTGAANNYYYKNGDITTGAKDVEVLVIFPYASNVTVAKFDKFDKAHEGWYIKGTKINHAGNRHVIIAEEWEGFSNIGGGKVSVVWVEGMAGAAHAEFTKKGSYITGSTKTEFIVYDMATGKDIYVTATNMKIEYRGLYITHDDVIVGTLEETGMNMFDYMAGCYGLNSAVYGDGNEWVMGTFKTTSGDYNHAWVKQFVIPRYAASWINELKALYGEGSYMYNYLYARMEESFFTDPRYTNNDEGVKLYDITNLGTTNARIWAYKKTSTGAQDYTYNGCGINRYYCGWDLWQATINPNGETEFGYIINTKTGSVSFFVDLSQW